MKLLHDYILVEEYKVENKLGDTGLTIKYDDSERFMFVRVLDVSPMLKSCYLKDYPTLTPTEANTIVSTSYTKGNILIINRVAKTPYKDGQYFISYKDVIAVEQGVTLTDDDKERQLTLISESD